MVSSWLMMVDFSSPEARSSTWSSLLATDIRSAAGGCGETRESVEKDGVPNNTGMSKLGV